MNKNEKGFAHVGLILLVVLVVGVIGFAGYRISKNNSKKSETQTVQQPQQTVDKQVSTQTAPKEKDPYEGWKTYTSPLKSGLSFKYPADWYFPTPATTIPAPNNLGGIEIDNVVYSVQPKSEGYSNVVNQYMCISVDEYSSNGWDFPSNWKLGKELSSEKFSISTTPVTLGIFAGDTPMQSEMILYTPNNTTGNHFVSTKNNYVVSVKAGYNACQQSDGGITNKQADFDKQPETATAKLIIKSVKF